MIKEDNIPPSPKGNDYITKKELEIILEEHKEQIQRAIEGRIESIVRSYCDKTVIPLVKSEISKVLIQSKGTIEEVTAI